MNTVSIEGNLTRDAELKYTTNGTAVLNFSIASNDKMKDKEEVVFIECTVFGKYAEAIAQYLIKGTPVLVIGSLKQDHWVDNQGKAKSKIYIKVDKMKMFGRKNSDSSKYKPAPKAAPAQKQEEIPDVDINEEDIPF